MRAFSTGSRAEFWREVVARQRGSGLSIKAFCAQEGLAAATFFVWKRRLGQGSGTATVAFAAVRVQPDTVPTPAGAIEILLPHDRRIRLTGTVDRQQLAAVLAALAE